MKKHKRQITTSRCQFRQEKTTKLEINTKRSRGYLLKERQDLKRQPRQHHTDVKEEAVERQAMEVPQQPDAHEVSAARQAAFGPALEARLVMHPRRAAVIRREGTDLIQNHLTMCLHGHTSVWERKLQLWSREVFKNHITQVMNEITSKSQPPLVGRHPGGTR